MTSKLEPWTAWVTGVGGEADPHCVIEYLADENDENVDYDGIVEITPDGCRRPIQIIEGE